MSVISSQEAYSFGEGDLYQKTLPSPSIAYDSILYLSKIMHSPFSFVGVEGGPCPSTGIIWPRNMNVLKG